MAEYIYPASSAGSATSALSASYALQTLSSSYALTASYAQTTSIITSSSVSSSFATNAATASLANALSFVPITASYALTASVALNVQAPLSTSHALIADVALLANTASYIASTVLAATASSGIPGFTVNALNTPAAVFNLSASVSSSGFGTFAVVTNANSNIVTGSSVIGNILANISADGPAVNSLDSLVNYYANNTVNADRSGTIQQQVGLFGVLTRTAPLANNTNTSIIGAALGIEVGANTTASEGIGYTTTIFPLTTASLITSGTGYRSIATAPAMGTVGQYIGFHDTANTASAGTTQAYAFVSDKLPSNFGGPVTASAFKGDGTQIVNIVTSSYAQTASVALNAGPVISASYALTASVALNATPVVTASYALQSATASVFLGTSSYASFAATASVVIGSISTASLALQALTASYFSGSGVISGTFIGSITSASYALTASYALNSTGGSSVSASYATTSSAAQSLTYQIVLGRGKYVPWVADGETDCTTTLRTAVSDASANLNVSNVIKIPALSDTANGIGVLVSASFGNPILIPSYIVLEGEGPGSHISIATGSYIGVVNQSISCINITGPYAQLRNFRIDGQCAAVKTMAQVTASFGTIPVYAQSGSHDLVFENIYCHDVHAFSSANESFGLMFSNGVYNSVMRGCVGYNVSGSFMHDAGNFLTQSNFNNQFIDCIGYVNTWNALSLFGINEALVKGCFFYKNGKRGINVEWSTKVSIFNCECRDNGNNGIGSYGFSPYLTIIGNTLQNNNLTLGNNFNGEMDFSWGTWSGFGGGQVGPGLTIDANHITPSTTNGNINSHISFNQGFNGNTATGSTMPAGANIRGANVADYNIYLDGPPFSTRYITPNINRQSLRDGCNWISPPNAPNPPQWIAVNGSGSIPVNVGTSGSTPFKFSATASGSTLSTGYIYPAGMKYYVLYALNALDNLSGWQFVVEDANTVYRQMMLGSCSVDANMWSKGDIDATVSASGGPVRLSIQATSATPSGSSILIDWVNIGTLSYIGGQNTNLNVTSSYALVAGSAGGTVSNATSASYALTASYAANAQAPVSVSYASNAGNANTATTASAATSLTFIPTTAATASYVLNAVSASLATAISFTPTLALTANTASYVLNAVSASAATSITFVPALATTANTASYVLNAVSASAANSITFVPTLAATASYVQNAVSASFALSASWAPGGGASISSSYATTASFAQSANITSVSVISGTVLLTSYSLATVPNGSYVFLSPNTGSLQVLLPSHSIGQNFNIRHTGTSGTLTVTDTSNVTQSAVFPHGYRTFVDDGTAWWTY